MIVMAPKDENELRHMLKTAMETDQPVSIRYPRGKGAGVPLDEQPEKIPLGRAEILQDGEDLAIVAIGSTVLPALAAAQDLLNEGIRTTVINARFVKPLDGDLICRVASTCRRLITVEENVLTGGFGSAVLELLQDKGITEIQIGRANV